MELFVVKMLSFKGNRVVKIAEMEISGKIIKEITINIVVIK